MKEEVIEELENSMEDAIESLRREFSKVRTGRASLSLLDGIKVQYYGELTPLNQIATLSVPEARLITIQPWDTKIIGEIEKAIQKSGLGLTPINDGKLIRISIPNLTEERRQELIKVVRGMAEDCKVSIRNARRETNNMLKEMKKEKEISEDELFKLQGEVQKITDKYVEKSDETLAAKEKEVLEI
ncbi:MAG: ribosome recycling factor [Desulfobacterales bacterium]|jgi:ribosome recycling factor|nr:ribosome recycling factor [Desulfobacterales bacterium]